MITKAGRGERGQWGFGINTYTRVLCAQSLGCVRLFVTPWTVPRQAPLSMGFSRQEYWSGVPSPSPGDLPDPGVEPLSSASPAPQADSLPSEPPGKPMSTGAGSLSLLQGIFPTQELNQSLVLCRQILYQGSPHIHTTIYKIDNQQGPTV